MTKIMKVVNGRQWVMDLESNYFYGVTHMVNSQRYFVINSANIEQRDAQSILDEVIREDGLPCK